MDQEMASVMRFLISHAGEISPYYWNVPEKFMVPAIYFPPPEVDTGGETFDSYRMDFDWYIKIFHKTAQGAYAIGNALLTAIRSARNLIPMVAEDGSIMENAWVRVDDPRLKVVDGMTAELTMSWRSRRPYEDTVQEVQQAQVFHLETFLKPGKEISKEDAERLMKYSVPL